MEKLYVCMDKSGSVHISNTKPIKPQKTKKNPDANDEIFIPSDYGYSQSRQPKFFIALYGQIRQKLIDQGLTFENSPMEVELTIK